MAGNTVEYNSSPEVFQLNLAGLQEHSGRGKEGILPPKPVIGHGIGGIIIPAKMARLAKARHWSKRFWTCLSSPDLTATQISDGAKIQVRRRHVLWRYHTDFLSRISDAISNK